MANRNGGPAIIVQVHGRGKEIWEREGTAVVVVVLNGAEVSCHAEGTGQELELLLAEAISSHLLLAEKYEQSVDEVLTRIMSRVRVPRQGDLPRRGD